MTRALTAACLAAGLLLTPTAAHAAGDRLVWKDRMLLTLEGGRCETDGHISATYELWIVPTLTRVGKRWIPGENTEVRVLIDAGGEPCR